LIYLISGACPALADPADPDGFAKCKVIDDNQARLDCLKKLLGSAPAADSSAGSTSDDRWSLVVTPPPAHGTREAVSIMRTADTTRSDPDLAGLMIRCQQEPGLQVLLALVRPLPPRARRDVTINPTMTPTVLHAEVSSQGTGIVLPVEPTMFTTGQWRNLKELAVLIQDPEADIRGVIPLDGIAPALAKLSARCPAG
jgi:hypothetical protein